MEAALLLRQARAKAHLTLRDLADRAGTSHSTLSSYEQGRTAPGTGTLERVVRAAGFRLEVALVPEPADRGDELWQALELAAMFPARHAPSLQAPRFRPSPTRAP